MRGSPSVGALVGLALVATVLAGSCRSADPATAEPARLGVLRAVPDDDHAVIVEELRDRGWGPTQLEVLPADPLELHPDPEGAAATLDAWVRDGIDLVIAFSTPLAQLAAERAASVPGLFLVNDPVAAGLVTDPRHPDGSMTGVTFRTPADRTLDLADRALGGLSRVGYLFPDGDAGVPGHRRGVLAAAEELGIEVEEASFTDADGVEDAVGQLADAGVQAVLLASSNGTFRVLDAIAAALDAHDLPAIANTDFAEFAVVIVTPDGAEVRRQLARQAVRLLAGADVSAVPVEDPRKFVVILNRTQAAELGLPPFDPDLLRQADVVR